MPSQSEWSELPNARLTLVMGRLFSACNFTFDDGDDGDDDGDGDDLKMVMVVMMVMVMVVMVVILMMAMMATCVEGPTASLS